LVVTFSDDVFAGWVFRLQLKISKDIKKAAIKIILLIIGKVCHPHFNNFTKNC